MEMERLRFRHREVDSQRLEVSEREEWEKRLSDKGKWLYHVVGKKALWLRGKGEKKRPSAPPEKGVIEGTSWMTNWGGYEMRLDSIHTLESTLPYGMYQMGSQSGAFPLIIPFQCYASTPCRRNLTGTGRGGGKRGIWKKKLKYRSISKRGKTRKVEKQRVSNIS